MADLDYRIAVFIRCCLLTFTCAHGICRICRCLIHLVDIKVGVGFAYGLYARMYVVVACGKVAQVAQHQVARAGHRVNEVGSADDIIIGFAQIHVVGSGCCAVDVIKGCARVVNWLGQGGGGIVGEILLVGGGSHGGIICPGD